MSMCGRTSQWFAVATSHLYLRKSRKALKRKMLRIENLQRIGIPSPLTWPTDHHRAQVQLVPRDIKTLLPPASKINSAILCSIFRRQQVKAEYASLAWQQSEARDRGRQMCSHRNDGGNALHAFIHLRFDRHRQKHDLFKIRFEVG